jgi:hypothetical protein
MLNNARTLSVVAALTVVSAVVFGFRLADTRVLESLAAPATDALAHDITLTKIAKFHYVNDRTLDVTDGKGTGFKMELTEDCPGLKGAKDISLVTNGFDDLDRFTAIAVAGRVCTFKDFAPRADG